MIEGKTISTVASDLSQAARSAIVVDATDRIVMPGFVDTHHHQYETLLRSILSDGLLRDWPNNYTSVIQGVFTPLYLPEDACISEFVASLNQINAGGHHHCGCVSGVPLAPRTPTPALLT